MEISSGGQDKIGTSDVGDTHCVFGHEGDMGLGVVTEPSWRLSASVETYGSAPVTVTGATEPLIGEQVGDGGGGEQVGVLTNVPRPGTPMKLAGALVEGIVGWAPCSDGQAIAA